jgi:methylisocitrate lyase
MISERNALVVPGAYDALSAILIEKTGFKALQVSGFGISGSFLGKPDVGLLTFTEMLVMTKNIVKSVDIPVMADGDTGFGNAINLIRTVEESESIGCAGINLEDQTFPKRCGHLEGKSLISIEEMVLKIKAAVNTKKDPDFVINARTDAISVFGIDEAIKRGNAYAEAGADLIFLEAISGRGDIEKAVKEIKAPISINLFDAIGGGKTKLISLEELRNLGVARVSVPVGTIFAAAKGIKTYLEKLFEKGILPDSKELAMTFDEWKTLLEVDKIYRFERKYLPGN